MKAPVVFDVDGTLTLEPYTPNNIRKVKENPAMVLVAVALQKEHPLLVSTARPEKWRLETEEWLRSHGINAEKVYMRDANRSEAADQMIKFGHLQAVRDEYGQPVIWIDDNPANVNMLRRNDVPVIHVQQ